MYTRDVNRAFRAIRDITTGIVYVNAGTIGVEVHLPFGGTRGTGNGHREVGAAALDVYSEWKTIFVDDSDKLERAQIDLNIAGRRYFLKLRRVLLHFAFAPSPADALRADGRGIQYHGAELIGRTLTPLASTVTRMAPESAVR